MPHSAERYRRDRRQARGRRAESAEADCPAAGAAPVVTPRSLAARSGSRSASSRAGIGATDGDEAMWGLMARHVLDGEFPRSSGARATAGRSRCSARALLWAFAGASVAGARSSRCGLTGVAAVLVWRVGRRTVGGRRARGRRHFWVWPAYAGLEVDSGQRLLRLRLVAGAARAPARARLAERARGSASRCARARRRRRLLADRCSSSRSRSCGHYLARRGGGLRHAGSLWLASRRVARRAARLADLEPPPRLVVALPSARRRAPTRRLRGFLDGGACRCRSACACRSTLVGREGRIGRYGDARRFAVLRSWSRGAKTSDEGHAPAVCRRGVLPAIAHSGYTWIVDEPRYLYIVSPVFALLVSVVLTSWRRARGRARSACRRSPSVGLVAHERLTSFAERADGMYRPGRLRPAHRGARAPHVDRATPSTGTRTGSTSRRMSASSPPSPPQEGYARRGDKVVVLENDHVRYRPYLDEVTRSPGRLTSCRRAASTRRTSTCLFCARRATAGDGRAGYVIWYLPRC